MRTLRHCKRDYIFVLISMACLLFPVLSWLAVAEGQEKNVEIKVGEKKMNHGGFSVGSMLKKK